MELVVNIIEEIIKKHVELVHKQLGTLELAIHIGALLTQQKMDSKHGEFAGWIKETLPFSIRTAQKYMNVFANKDKLLALGADGLNDAYLLLAPEKDEEDPNVHIHNNPVHEEEDPEEGEMLDVTPDIEPHSQTSYRDYWDHLQPLIEKMESVHKRLIGLRNSTTPDALGFMFGNIQEMANMLASWDPAEIKDHEICSGKGCSECLDGKIGMYRETEF